MTPRIQVAVETVALAGATLWWAPTFGLALLQAAPHLAAVLGTPRRVARVRRLMAAGDLDEADRVVAALTRERAAAARWRAAGGA